MFAPLIANEVLPQTDEMYERKRHGNGTSEWEEGAPRLQGRGKYEVRYFLSLFLGPKGYKSSGEAPSVIILSSFSNLLIKG